MPLLFSVGQHAALLHRDERLFAFLDDIYVVSKPERVGEVHSVLERELWVHAKIRVHSGKTHVWNRSGRMPPACDELQRRAVLQDPTAQVWTGSGVPTQNQGIKVLGCPLGHEDFVTTQLEAIGTKHQVLLQAIPTVPDVQSAWLLPLHCAAARANFCLRVEGTMGVCGSVSPESWACLRTSVMTWHVLPQLCRSLLVVWGKGARKGRESRLIGRAGPTRCP